MKTLDDFDFSFQRSVKRDEVMHLAQLGFLIALVSSRYERSSLIVSSNKTFSSWAEIFGDPIAVAALVDRLVHHSEVIVMRRESYRLKGKQRELLEGEGRS